MVHWSANLYLPIHPFAVKKRWDEPLNGVPENGEPLAPIEVATATHAQPFRIPAIDEATFSDQDFFWSALALCTLEPLLVGVFLSGKGGVHLELIEEVFYRGPSRFDHVVKHPTAFIMPGSMLHNNRENSVFWLVDKEEGNKVGNDLKKSMDRTKIYVAYTNFTHQFNFYDMIKYKKKSY